VIRKVGRFFGFWENLGVGVDRVNGCLFLKIFLPTALLNHPRMNCGLWGQVPPGLLNLSPGGTFAVSPQFIRGRDAGVVFEFEIAG
jgi:hypothetical protein